MNTQTEEKLVKANELRESEQYGDSAKLFTECLLDLIPSGDPRQLVHCLAGHSLIFKILTKKHDSRIFKNLTLAYSQEAYEVCKSNQENLDSVTLSTAYMGYADALFMNDQIAESLPLFEKALAVSTADIPEKGRLKTHLAEAKYLLGDKEAGLNLALESLSDIRTGDLTSYSVRVWETGALNTLVNLYVKEGQTDKAKSLAQESLKIANENNLSIRKREIESIISSL